MANFELYFSDAEREQPEKAIVTPIVCGEYTPEEYEQAMQELYFDNFFGGRK